jgi:D-3-phosphoglycerate dehydrogenase
MGLLFSRFKIDKTFLDKASNLQFIARVGAGLENRLRLCSIKKNYAHCCPEGIGMQLRSIL